MTLNDLRLYLNRRLVRIITDKGKYIAGSVHHAKNIDRAVARQGTPFIQQQRPWLIMIKREDGKRDNKKDRR